MIEVLKKGGSRGPSGWVGADLREQERLSPAVSGRRRGGQMGAGLHPSLENQGGFWPK